MHRHQQVAERRAPEHDGADRTDDKKRTRRGRKRAHRLGLSAVNHSGGVKVGQKSAADGITAYRAHEKDVTARGRAVVQTRDGFFQRVSEDLRRAYRGQYAREEKERKKRGSHACRKQDHAVVYAGDVAFRIGDETYHEKADKNGDRRCGTAFPRVERLREFHIKNYAEKRPKRT